MGEFIRIGDQKIYSYLATPETPNGAGVVLGCAVWGLNFDFVDFAECYAALGYTVLAPNLFWRVEPEHKNDYDFSDIEFVHGLAESGSDDEGMADMRLARDELKEKHGCTKVAALGWCYGGRLACRLATEESFDACIGVYPTFLDKHLDIAGSIRRPMHIHLPELERYGSTEDSVERQVAAFKDTPLVETFVYPGAEHGFDFAPPHKFSKHGAARLCDSRIVRFLDEQLL